MPAHTPRRIALVGPIPPPAGGMANQTAQLREFLERDGLDVELVPVNAPYRPALVGRVPLLRAAFRLGPYLLHLAAAARRNEVVHVMANSGWAWHLFATPAVWMARLFRRPVLVNYRGGHAETFFARSWRVVAPTLAQADAVVVPSAYLEDVFAQRGHAADVVPNVLDVATFHPRTPARAPGNAPHLVVTRNLEAIYDISTALRCLAALRDRFPGARLSVAGSGPERGALEAEAESLGLADSVRFLGRLERDAMAALYRDADVMLNPSTVDNSPNSIIEALASGVPVVSTNAGGIPRLVRHEHDALLLEPRDPQSMATAAARVLSDADLRKQLVTNGLATIEKFKWSSVGARLRSHYEQLAT